MNILIDIKPTCCKVGKCGKGCGTQMNMAEITVTVDVATLSPVMILKKDTLTAHAMLLSEMCDRSSYPHVFFKHFRP